MKFLVIGATGMVGTQIVTEALSRGHTIVAASRHPEKVVPQDNVEAVALDVYDANALGALANDVDVVISAVSPRNTGDAEAEAVAYANALIAGVGATRLMVVGGAGTLNLPNGDPVWTVVPEAYLAEAKGMRAAYELIAASDLDFTVHAPAGVIAPGERTGVFRTGGRTIIADAEGNSNISVEDYAIAFLDEIEKPAYAKTVFTAAY